MKEFDYKKQPTVTIVKEILQDALSKKVTDIHLDPIDDGMIIKFRIDGELEDYTLVPENNKVNIITRFKILSGMNITNTFMPQTGSLKINHDNSSFNTRVATIPVIYGEKIVIHISNYAEDIKNIDEIGFNKEDIEKIKQSIQEPQGLILINGSATSGKTTTMYSILKELNNKKRNIVSIENPVKMKIPGINQIQIQEDKGINYNTILRNVSLVDPNVIAIDELIDDEITRKAIRLAAAGNLVISKMPYKTIYQTIDSLLKMDVENYLLGSNLNEIICQRLVKKLCPNCRQKKKATEYEKKIIKEITDTEVDEIYYPVGCEECNNGYKDQIPVEEVIVLNDELRNAISNNRNRELIRKIIYSEINPLIKDGFNKVINGDTSFAEIIRILDTKIDLSEEQDDLKEFIYANVDIEETPAKEETKKESKEESKKDEVKEETKKDEVKEPVKEEKKKTKSPLETILESTSSQQPKDNTQSTESTYQTETKEKEPENEEPTKEEHEKNVKPFAEINEDEEQTKEDKNNYKEEESDNNKEISKKKSFFFDDDDDDDDDDDYNYDSSYKIV